MNIRSKIIAIAALPLILAACSADNSFGTASSNDAAAANSLNYVKRQGGDN